MRCGQELRLRDFWVYSFWVIGTNLCGGTAKSHRFFLRNVLLRRFRARKTLRTWSKMATQHFSKTNIETFHPVWFQGPGSSSAHSYVFLCSSFSWLHLANAAKKMHSSVVFSEVSLSRYRLLTARLLMKQFQLLEYRISEISDVDC